ncbi:CYTH domain-containing protein [Leifsonia sp. Root112D2]|uniref:CYTH domain-containing protein n=1 Tax=Leifsonia sp. Root112D2 TaxID=1736426 RepID=UPI0006FC13BF|nr:CYTH domain-containing protein [Leifsonia sp. Root112D2]KQV05164.1 hypothetical protein ASC63_15350 [Leifsonia sp. Root112D2]
MPHHSQIEIERKYDVDAETVVPDLVGIGAIAVAEPAQRTELLAVYFDTPDLRLGAARMALRRREGGADAGWHLKIARAGAEGRTELHWPLTDTDVVPDEVRAEVREIVGDAELAAVARVANTRLTVRLLDAAGHPLAELCDDHVHADDLRAGVTRDWREWEVELLAAAPNSAKKRAALLDAVEQAVLETGARASVSSSKVARALGIDPLG